MITAGPCVAPPKPSSDNFLQQKKKEDVFSTSKSTPEGEAV